MQNKQLENQYNAYQSLLQQQVGNSSSNSSSTGPQDVLVDEDDFSRPLNNFSSPPNGTTTFVWNDTAVEQIVVETNDTTATTNTTTQALEGATNETFQATNRTDNATLNETKTNATCFPFNSPRWLDGPRISNILDDNGALDTILTSQDLQWLLPSSNSTEPWDRLSSSTVCHANSTFRNPTLEQGTTARDRLLKEWQFRLTFWAIHSHHHAPAIPEARARKECSPEPTDPVVGPWDYECPDTKFLVANLPPMGMGASLRLGAANAMLMGLAIGRITVFVNNVPLANKSHAEFLQSPWPLASCNRHDLQCIFYPTTPCTLSQQDVDQATVLPEIAARSLRRQGHLADKYKDERILILEPRLNPPQKWRIQTMIQSALFQRTSQLLDALQDSMPEADMTLLREAAQQIRHDQSNVGKGDDAALTSSNASQPYNYNNRYTRISHAALLYLLRPLPEFQRRSDRLVRRSIPPDLEPVSTIGLPIRASDKCKSESICIGFDRHVLLVEETWHGKFPNATGPGNVVLTTEDSSIMESSKAYAANESFPLRFVSNKKDTFQGTGNPRIFARKGDAVMTSTLVSIKLQLHAGIVFGNCCSNFHLVLFDLLSEGCGAVPEPTTMCLQEHPDPRFHICCGWTKTEECDRVREEKRLLQQAYQSVGNSTRAYLQAERKEIERLRLLQEEREKNNNNSSSTRTNATTTTRIRA